MFAFCFVVELLRSKDNDLRKILDEKSKLVAELRVKILYYIELLGLNQSLIASSFLSTCLVVTVCMCNKSHTDN